MAGNPTIATPAPFAVKPTRVNIFAKPSPATSAAGDVPRQAGVFDEAAACEPGEGIVLPSGYAASNGRRHVHASRPLLRLLSVARSPPDLTSHPNPFSARSWRVDRLMLIPGPPIERTRLDKIGEIDELAAEAKTSV